MSDKMTAGLHRRLVARMTIGIAVALVVALSGCGSGSDVAVSADDASRAPPNGGGAWETYHEFGRWVVGADPQTIRIERANMRSRCADHRVVIADESNDQWLIRFETRVTDKQCLAGGCVDCSLELSLDRVVPPGVDLLAVCDPNASIFATTVPGGAQVTLRQTSEATEAVVCSAVPDPTGTFKSTTARPPREHVAVDFCAEPPDDLLTTSGVLSVEPELVSAGDELTFRWEVTGRGPFTVGDEMVVWCWSGTDWTPAWVTYSVFMEPFSILITPDNEEFTITDDGFQEATGTIVVPDEAAPGTYRLADTISFDSEEGGPEREADQAFFIVTD